MPIGTVIRGKVYIMKIVVNLGKGGPLSLTWDLGTNYLVKLWLQGAALEAHFGAKGAWRQVKG